MQAFIKDSNKLIVNSQILDNEKQELIEFTKKADKAGVSVMPLYDVEGDVAGIQFIVNSVDRVNTDKKEEDRNEDRV